MKLRFYFDYSDYRSYLMMHALRMLDDLPVSVQWIALDAYSLRALSGCASHDQSPNEREFLRREAQRFCIREGLEFVWQSEKIHHGTALRAGVWLMTHDLPHFEPFSRKVLETMWGLGKIIDAAMLRQILTELDIHAETMLGSVSERENFQHQDACLQEALADGVFDVPAVVIGDELICHFDQAEEMRRLALIEWLQTLPSAWLCQTLARELLTKTREDFRQTLSNLTRKFGLRPTTNTQIEGINAIQHTLAIPSTHWHISKHPVREELKIHICKPGRTLAEIFASTQDGVVNICAQTGLEYDKSWNFDVSDMSPRLFYAWVNVDQSSAMLCLRIDAGGHLHTTLIEERDFAEETIRGWSIMSISPLASSDLNLARFCAHHGAHCIIRTESDRSSLYASEAFGTLATAWIIEISPKGISIIDAEAHRKSISPGSVISLTGSFRLSDIPAWQPPAPRTLLLCDKSLTFGELSAHADIELSSRGTSLLVTTAEQTSELISSRPFEKLRVNGEIILLMPLNAEQLFITELLSHRLLDAFNQAPRESLPIFVSYWSELEFEMLEIIRPVLAALVRTFQMPIILVVGTQVVELWLANAQGYPYCIEKENDCFCIDMTELISNEQSFSQILSSLGISEQHYLMRLQNIENAARK